MVSSDLWNADTAARYDDPEDPMFANDIVMTGIGES